MPDLPRSHLVAYGLALLAVVGFGLRQVLHSRAAPTAAGVPLRADGASGGGGAGTIGAGARGGAGAGTDARKLVVHVAGAVRRPGVYRFADGLRVDDAVRRAGGPRRGADLSQLNLAAELEDGRQVLVPLRPGVVAAGGAGARAPRAAGCGAASAGRRRAAPAGAVAGAAGAAGGAVAPRGTGAVAGPPLNLNTATLEQLDTLDGVGPVTAQKILAYRQEHNGFGTRRRARSDPRDRSEAPRDPARAGDGVSRRPRRRPLQATQSDRSRR